MSVKPFGAPQISRHEAAPPRLCLYRGLKETYGACDGRVRLVRFIHHDGLSSYLCEAHWYYRLSVIDDTKRRKEGGPRAEARLRRIEPITEREARKEGWFPKNWRLMEGGLAPR